MKTTIDISDKELISGSALRNVEGWSERTRLVYDPELPARCNDIILGEIHEVHDVKDNSIDDLEEFSAKDGRLSFALKNIRPGLVAIPVGNRYAPAGVTGGLNNPVTGEVNGVVLGGETIYNMSSFNLAGFINYMPYEDHPLTAIKVLGTILENNDAPLSLLDHSIKPEAIASKKPLKSVLVCGAGMEIGKTTCCISIMQALKERGRKATFEKKTGTAYFCDPLRVLKADIDAYGSIGQSIELSSDELISSDFVDACGTVSDVSIDQKNFVQKSVNFTHSFAAKHNSEVHIVELADSVAHSSNLALLNYKAFRDLFTHIVYVPNPSLDSAFHFLYYLQNGLGWDGPKIALGGPLANDLEYEMLREEVEHRLKVPCLNGKDKNRWMEWLFGELI